MDVATVVAGTAAVTALHGRHKFVIFFLQLGPCEKPVN
jgi:hypothetical protein